MRIELAVKLHLLLHLLLPVSNGARAAGCNSTVSDSTFPNSIVEESPRSRLDVENSHVEDVQLNEGH